MSIKHIDTAAKDIRPKKGSFYSGKWRLFLKTALVTFAVTFGVLIVVGIIVAALLFPQVKSLEGQVNNTYSQAKKLESSLKERDIKQSEADLVTLQNSLKITHKKFNNLGFVRFIPIAAGYYQDAGHLLNAADIGAEIGQKSLIAVEPFGDILGFKGVEEKLNAKEKAEKLVTEVIPKLIPLVDEIGQKVDLIDKEIQAIDENHYPQNFEIKGVKVRDSLKAAKQGLTTVKSLLPQAKPLLQAAPEIAGVPDERIYLVLLQNDKELRASGGFITAYALVKVKDGQIVSTESDDIYQMDLKFRRTELAPEAIQKYIGNNTLPIRDSNFSPDYKVDAEKFESMYNTIKSFPKVDGVFALDTEFVRSLLEVTGPITTKKTHETFSAANNLLAIPDVVYKLELIIEKIHGGKNDRKGIVGELMDSLLDKVTNAKTDEFPKYIDTVLNTIKGKHLLFYFHNQTIQDFVEKYNAAGQIHSYNKDYFHLNNSNFGGLKGNIYIKQAVVQDINIASDGTVTKKVDVTLTNPVKADGWLNSIYLNWMRVYVPKNSKLVSEKVQKDFTSGEELGKEVFRGYGATSPLSKSVSEFVYELPFKVNPGEPYKMLIQKQGGISELDMTIKINGVTHEHFMLREDKELSINW